MKNWSLKAPPIFFQNCFFRKNIVFLYIIRCDTLSRTIFPRFEKLLWGAEKPDFGFVRSVLGSERRGLGSERPDLESEGFTLGSEGFDLGSERPDLGSERPNLVT